jgi:UDP-N-acetylmuramate dehydrogenase
MITAFDEALAAAVPDSAIRRQEPLAEHTTLQVGGPADWFVTVSAAGQLGPVLRAARAHGVPVTMLGGGSNVVVADEGIRGLVLRLQLTGISTPSADRVRAEAGVTMNGLVRWMVGRGLSGLEAWAGTPGTVGGAVYGNAHYGGQNISERIVQVHVVSRDGDEVTVARADMGFAYDTSRVQTTGEIVVWADFEAGAGVPDALRAVARRSLAHRKQTQPLALPSAGCLFQNPDPARDRLPDGMPASAGALIDRAGLKGHRIGGAVISPVHANFVVNDGTATAADIRELADQARTAVRERFGVELRNEVVFLGKF